MASWISHLRIAELIQKQMQFPSYKYFLIGNVAPDSGVLNEDRTSYTPSGEVSHFRSKESAKWNSVDLRYYRTYIQPALNSGSLSDELCFHFGYYTHLLVDRLFAYFIFSPIKEKYKESFEQDRIFGWEVRKNFHGLDVEYLQNHPDWMTWHTFLESYYNLDCLEFYPAKNIRKKLEEIKNNFHVEEGVVWPNQFLTQNDWDLFIQAVPVLVIDILKHLEAIETECLATAMEYLEKKYDFLSEPVGDLGKLKTGLSEDELLLQF
jgi:hypothetical protein